MGKRLITQRRGRGGSHYRSPSHRHIGSVSLPKLEGVGTVMDIINSPGHTSPVAVVEFGKEKVLMLASEGLRIGQKVSVGMRVVETGSVLEIGQIPEGVSIFNIEIQPGDGGRLVRTAGTYASVVSKGEKTVVKLPSGQFKELNPRCRATVGIVAGGGHREKPFAKAGKKYHAYKSRSKAHLRVRGVAMNPVDHPHGGGSHKHVGRPSTVSRDAPPGRKVGRLSPQRKKRRK
ncbi:MAG: 50S ribosomal protein L2 [Thermoplasmata archaeon]|nr:50S ribosomal protein L2 [Thermoplasmata archaeon]